MSNPRHIKIANTSMRVHYKRILLDNGIKTLGDLAEKNSTEVMRYKGCTTTAYAAFERALKKAGLKFFDDPSEYERRVDQKLWGMTKQISDLGFKLSQQIVANEFHTKNFMNHLSKFNELVEAVAQIEEHGGHTVSLRDQFAMAALPAIIQNKGIQTTTLAAEVAYAMADAMLKAREAE